MMIHKYQTALGAKWEQKVLSRMTQKCCRWFYILSPRIFNFITSAVKLYQAGFVSAIKQPAIRLAVQACELVKSSEVVFLCFKTPVYLHSEKHLDSREAFANRLEAITKEYISVFTRCHISMLIFLLQICLHAEPHSNSSGTISLNEKSFWRHVVRHMLSVLFEYRVKDKHNTGKVCLSFQMDIFHKKPIRLFF